MKRALSHVLSLCLVAGCAAGTGGFDELPEGDIVTTESCEELLDHGARPLAVGSIEGTSRYVLDTNQGRCVEDRDELIDSLRRHDHGALVAQLSRATDPAAADPSPHPDIPGDIKPPPSMEGDPSPHPDTNADIDSADEEEATVVVIWIVVVQDDDMADSSHGN